MKKETYQNKLDKRPYDNKKAKENDEINDSKLFSKAIKKSESKVRFLPSHIPMTKEEIRKSGLVNPIEFNTGENSEHD